MKALILPLQAELRAGRSAALCTVLERRGSAPRGAGACLLRRMDGSIVGTVGGGALEHAVCLRADKCLRTGRPALLAYALAPGEAAGLGMVCGGDVTVHIWPWGAAELPLAEALAARLAAEGDLWLARQLAPNGAVTFAAALNREGLLAAGEVSARDEALVPGNALAPSEALAPGNASAQGNAPVPREVPVPDEPQMPEQTLAPGEALAPDNASMPGNAPAPHAPSAPPAPAFQALAPLLRRLPVWQDQPDGARLFVEPVRLDSHAYVFGGGHIAAELVPLLARLDFAPVVFEDRPEFAAPERFPDASRVVLGNFCDIGREVRLRADDFAVIMTRGHSFDHELLTQVLRTDARYIGLIGSRAKIARTRERLLAEGFADADFARVHTPIGLPIHAQTPAEIAVSVAAEMIACRWAGDRADAPEK